MEKILVIGNGMVGYKFCEKFIEKGGLQSFRLTVFGEENKRAYDRVHLSSYFTNPDFNSLALSSKNWYQDQGVELILNDKIIAVDCTKKQVTSQSGLIRDFDKLIIATGSSCFMPPIKGMDKKGVFAYRTIDDLDAIITYSKTCKTAAVLGGGLLGLEAAKAIKDLNLEAHVVEFAPRLMPRQLDDSGATLLREKIEESGVQIHLGKSTKEISGNGCIEGLSFKDDTFLEVDMLVVSAGIRPNDMLGKAMGLTLGDRGGIVVDNTLETSVKDVFAIGEVALFNNMIFGLVAPGYDMAEVLAHNLVSEKQQFFTAPDMSTKLKLIGTEVGSFGDALSEKQGESYPIIYQDNLKGIYKRINICKKENILLGGVLVGDTSSYGMLLQMTLNKMKLPENPSSLITPATTEGGTGMSVADLPGDALICSCENITKEAICNPIKEGTAVSLNDIKKCTKAGTGCGGCIPMINDLIEDTLQSLGKDVKKYICEHFTYTRQELYSLIQVKSYKSYDIVLENLGTGSGCETCKPLVVSLLASIWNDLILDNNNDTAQDTNDRFLANIQRGGTYSVVPRIPGGEITPDKLIVIGQVAKKYDLYTKITGGQRIDMFGATLSDLPMIWEALIAAGFESGHAYGKSMRTVKSCVGSSWCRYGVQDAVGFAIEIEHRYKGIRSPHKLKSAVSGCVRECAEAQCKDFGIIATEKGWNLYVCGNGGAKPQHGSLLAVDLDRATCIRYIDRFLMFYIKTAEPLMRTSKWIHTLSGGIAYLKEVVIADSLGICDDLEIQMQQHVDSYICEWKDVVETPSKRDKFAHFVNSSQADSTIEFVPMRDMKMPKPWES